VLHALKTGTDAAIKTTAEEAAKATIRELQWPLELARELEKTRGVERQELRYKSYGALWARLRPLAIYDTKALDKRVVGVLSLELTDWYFSTEGGLLLTPQSRDFYFALQDLLQTITRIPGEWEAVRSADIEGTQEDLLREVLEKRQAVEAIAVLDYFKGEMLGDWQSKATQLGKNWGKEIKKVAADWSELDERERFATLQQVGSKLRSALVTDLESRLR
jgi:hypothetical protein